MYQEERPPVVLESTGHYHTPVVQYFEDKGYLYHYRKSTHLL